MCLNLVHGNRQGVPFERPSMKLQRYDGNPILSPHPDHAWEDLAVFNPAAWYDETTGEVLLLYRAAESGPEYKCYFGLAKSQDGYHFERVSDRAGAQPERRGLRWGDDPGPAHGQDGRLVLRHLCLPALPVRAVLGSRGAEEVPHAGRVPRVLPPLPADQRHAHGPAADAGFQDVDSGRLADRPPAGRPRRGPVPGEGRRQVRHDAPAAGMGRAASTASSRPAPGSPSPTT